MEELQVFLAAVDNNGGNMAFRDRLIVETMFWGAMRVSEATKLDVSHIRYDLKPPRVEIKQAKGKKDRVIPMNPEVLSRIKVYINQTRERRKKYYRENPVFLSREGKRLTTRRIEQMVADYATHSGIRKRITPHTFRHSFAVYWVTKGGDRKSLQQFLGHEWFQTTEVYLNHTLSFDVMEEAYANLK